MTRFFSVLITIAFLLVETISFPLSSLAATRTVTFDNREWNVKSGNYGPGPNFWTNDPSDVYVDEGGALHLTVVNHSGTWYSSEVWLPSSLGYGVYEFQIDSDIASIDPNLIGAPFLYQDDTHELDIEYTRWSDSTAPNTWYSIQPAYLKGHQTTYRTTTNGVGITARIEWTSDHVTFSTWQAGTILNSWTYAGSDNFVPGNERLHINFWQNQGWEPLNGTRNEFVVKNFRFTQASSLLITNPTTTTTIAPTTTKQKKVLSKKRRWR
ncbi:glycoside hydrolase family 16 protein [Candidatus Uhrbacteria bacterium]|nr:glycoside hydrolase family 16 protein [Candidatus Uhrbacteria bacterium]